MKGKHKVLRDVISPGAHRYVLCFPLRFGLWYSAHASKKGERDSTRKEYGEGGSESEASKTVELRSAFETKNSAMTNIHAIWSYQQAKFAMRTVHVSTVGMRIHFWRSGASWESSSVR